MKSMKYTISFLLLVIVIINFCHFTQGQTCANKSQATKCPSCQVCTGPSLSCCDSFQDASIGITLNLFQLRASESCLSVLKEFSCAMCDPKNQQFASTSTGVQMCKSKCLSIKSACPTMSSSFDCTIFPETNCWNSANSIGMNQLIVMILLVSIFVF